MPLVGHLLQVAGSQGVTAIGAVTARLASLSATYKLVKTVAKIGGSLWVLSQAQNACDSAVFWAQATVARVQQGYGVASDCAQMASECAQKAYSQLQTSSHCEGVKIAFSQIHTAKTNMLNKLSGNQPNKWPIAVAAASMTFLAAAGLYTWKKQQAAPWRRALIRWFRR